jgi:Bifunctional DNA primase/polymerase, N-terminal/Primase C terminal 1 (PriCT-1)
MTGIFSTWQPIYAERGMATFPVGEAKKPCIRGWQKIGPKVSAELAKKFLAADALGYLTGRRSGVTVLDIDTTDQKIAQDAIRQHGHPAIITRTASGKLHLLYRYNGEGRRIRPWTELPIDILGDNSYALAAPSKFATGTYEIIHGHLDDLDRLTPMRLAGPGRPHIEKGARNNALWRHCMRQAHHCDDFDALLDVARTFNESCQPPLEENEVLKSAESAWNYTERGQNRFGQHGAYFPIEEVVTMQNDADAFFLLGFLRAHNGPWATFMCTNSLAETFGWDRRRLADARSRLIELGKMKPVRQAGRGHPALFQWTD